MQQCRTTKGLGLPMVEEVFTNERVPNVFLRWHDHDFNYKCTADKACRFNNNAYCQNAAHKQTKLLGPDLTAFKIILQRYSFSFYNSAYSYVLRLGAPCRIAACAAKSSAILSGIGNGYMEAIAETSPMSLTRGNPVESLLLCLRWHCLPNQQAQ